MFLSNGLMLANGRLSCNAVCSGWPIHSWTPTRGLSGVSNPQGPLAPLRLDALTSGGEWKFAFSGQTKFGFVGLKAPEVKMVMTGNQVLADMGGM